MNDIQRNLYACLLRVAQYQKEAIDRISLHAVLVENWQKFQNDSIPEQSRKLLNGALKDLHLPAAKWLSQADLQTQFPVLLFDQKMGWVVLRGRNAHGRWVIDALNTANNQWAEVEHPSLDGGLLVQVKLARPYRVSDSTAFGVIWNAVMTQRTVLLEIVMAGILVNLLALATSLYSMQVYDRVVPTGATETLLALTIAVFGSVFFEALLKLIKSRLTEYLSDKVDAVLSREVYTRFLAIRLDQMPSSVGGLASQLRGYETVRSFLSSVPSQLLIDFPFLFIYSLLVMVLGGWIGWIPLVFLLISVVLGISYKRRTEALTRLSTNASNLKTGLLVESIEGAETIKSGQGGWRMLSKWLQTTDEARQLELQTKQISEHSQHLIAAIHQVSYVAMVATGALLVSKGQMTMGALIACTILSGRILGPIATLPNILIQWGHSLTALQSLDRFWALQSDHHEADQPVVLEHIHGEFQLENVMAAYGNQAALSIGALKIHAGEKVAILGPIGAGKTTLLRLLSGMYKPQRGVVKLDGVDLSSLSKPVLAENMGFLQQEGRLFSGTLRENLILGLIDPGDQALMDASRLTGLHQCVLERHPLGLQLPIHEGGGGLSGGQKQLTNLTRVFLRRPKIWLLDEPTASLDRDMEMKVMTALRATVRPTDTLVLVTHKPELLQLVDRIIVVANHQIVMDGPKTEVIKRLSPPQGSDLPLAS